MKEIKLLKTARISIGREPVDIGAAIEEHRQATRNSLEILGSALAIERSLSLAVSFFLLGSDMKKREFLDENILGSDWCGFAGKRKLICSVMQSHGSYTPAEIDAFDKAMSQVMKYRNAFAHGEVTHSKAGMTLKYFEGRVVEKLLDDAYWDGVSAAFAEAHDKAQALLARIGAIELVEPAIA
jgi:hypothetical protein